MDDAELPHAAEQSPPTREIFSSVKCSLGRLRCAPRLRAQIESVALRVHILAIRGTHIATELLHRAAQTGSELPDVDSQTWWYRCLSAGGFQSRGLPSEITAVAASLFGAAGPLDMSHLWPFVAELAKEMRKKTYTLLRQNLHHEVSKALHRILHLWEVRGSALLRPDEKERRTLVAAVLRYAERRGTRHRAAVAYPSAAPADLKRLLDAETDDWLRLFPELLPCPTPKFLSNCSKTRGILAWTLRLQQQSCACLAELSGLLGSGELARQRLGATCRAVRFLPLCATHLQPSCVYPTSLKALLAAMRSEECPRKRKREEGGDSEAEFWSLFPGARRLTPPQGRSNRKLPPFVRTDGVTASVVFRRTCPESELLPAEKLDLDCLKGGGRPPLPAASERLVAVDPGRRDLITAVFAHGERPPYVVSTKGFHRSAGTSHAGTVTKWALDVTDASLRAKLQDLPSSRSLGSWPS